MRQFVRQVKAFWGVDCNVGDRLTPILLRGLTDCQPFYVPEHTEGKLLMVGSLLDKAMPGDTILGTGLNDPDFVLTHSVRVLALRGPLTCARIDYVPTSVPFGDPALLLPLVYRPDVEVRHETGLCPHYADKPLISPLGDELLINIEADWRDVVQAILSCRKVVSSSLHGVAIAEAYGVDCEWAVWSDRIAGGPFKYQDYFLGTDRTEQEPFTVLPKFNVGRVQARLLEAVEDLSGYIEALETQS